MNTQHAGGRRNTNGGRGGAGGATGGAGGGFRTFSFRSADEIFADVFGSDDPFADFYDDFEKEVRISSSFD